MMTLKQLLIHRYDDLEQLWDQEPYNELYVEAVTIKEFMQDHQIEDFEIGLLSFKNFKLRQSKILNSIGLHNADQNSQKSWQPTKLAPQAA